MADFAQWPNIDVHILAADSGEDDEILRVGMGFLIGPRHVLTCAHVVAESIGERNAWIDQPLPPDRKVALALAFSRLHPDPIEATIENWWPERGVIANRPELDDVALLKLPDYFTLPADVDVAVRSLAPVLPNQEVHANGVTSQEQNGVSFSGLFRGRVVGGRWTVRTEGDDGGIAQGYSGAAVVTTGGVIGMIAERQQNRTAVLISVEDLFKEPAIVDAWQPPPAALGFLTAMTRKDEFLTQGVTTADSEWLRMPIGARLQRYLHHCDRAVAYEKIAGLAVKQRIRRPAIGVFGCDDDDLPEQLFDRFQTQFLVEAGIPEAEIAHPPRKWKLEEIPWRSPKEPVDRALATMKRALTGTLISDGPGAKAIRNALKAGKSQAFYSEISVNRLGPDDAELLKAWSDYLYEIGNRGLPKSIVHLICVKSPARVDDDSLEDAVSELAFAGNAEVVLDVGLLPCVDDDDLDRWFDSASGPVPLQVSEIFKLLSKANRELLVNGPPRLKQVEQWLAQLNNEDK